MNFIVLAWDAGPAFIWYSLLILRGCGALAEQDSEGELAISVALALMS